MLWRWLTLNLRLLVGLGVELSLLRSRLLLLGCHSLDVVPSPPTSPFVALKFLGNRGAWMLDIPDGLGSDAKSPELRESSREEPLRTKAEKALSPFNKVRL